MILAIDPGSEQSAFVLYEDGAIVRFGKLLNNDLLRLVYEPNLYNVMAIEMIASYGMPVGKEVFDTCLWIGRFIERCDPVDYALVYRKDVKLHLCNSPRANDATIRAALIDRYGGKASIKKGGALYGIAKDVWSALAVAIFYADTQRREAAA